MGTTSVSATAAKSNDISTWGFDEKKEAKEEEEDESEDDEPDYIDKEVDEEVEIETEVVKMGLVDDEYSNDEWFMSSAEKKSYSKYFKQADANQDGVVDGGEANKFFTKSKLSRKLLAKLWSLCVVRASSELAVDRRLNGTPTCVGPAKQ